MLPFLHPWFPALSLSLWQGVAAVASQTEHQTDPGVRHEVVVIREASAALAPTLASLRWMRDRIASGRPDEVCRWVRGMDHLGDLAPELLEEAGNAALEAEHPVLARTLFRQLLSQSPGDPRGLIGVGRSWLVLGRAWLAVRYGETVVAEWPWNPDGHEVLLRALVLAGRYDEALERGRRALALLAQPSAGLLSAHAATLFRLRQHREAAALYREVLVRDPLCAEANLKLGSGLAEPGDVEPLPNVRRSLALRDEKQFDLALDLIRSDLERRPGHPVGMRLLGELVLDRKLEGTWLHQEADAVGLFAGVPAGVVDEQRLATFFPGYDSLCAQRRQVVRRAAAVFWPELSRVAIMGGDHEIVPSYARTTDAPRRAALRGHFTFDGRLWDDVRGVGGLNAATGVEALDGALGLCFDTLVHEVAHQAHLFGFTAAERLQVRRLYDAAMRSGRVLDYYAQSNDTEYFAQGVEAFMSLAKRPGRQVTHGHTRFELYRKDPELYRFLERRVAFDPLRDSDQRDEMLAHAARYAITCGRAEDAVTAAAWIHGPEGDAVRALAARVRLREQSW